MTNVRVEVSGTMDGTPERFVAFTPDVFADSPDLELGRKMVTIAGRGCEVVNTLRDGTLIPGVDYMSPHVPYPGRAVTAARDRTHNASHSCH